MECTQFDNDIKQTKTKGLISKNSGVQTGGHVYTEIILLFSLALDITYAVLKISFATMPHALGPYTGSDIFRFVVIQVIAKVIM